MASELTNEQWYKKFFSDVTGPKAAEMITQADLRRLFGEIDWPFLEKRRLERFILLEYHHSRKDGDDNPDAVHLALEVFRSMARYITMLEERLGGLEKIFPAKKVKA